LELGSPNFSELLLKVRRHFFLSKFIKQLEMKNINIAVIGGTGKSGKFVVQQLIQQGFKLKLLLRNPEKFNVKNANVQVLKGDARDFNSVSGLVRGCEVVVSTLGQPKGESPIFSDATQNVLNAMLGNGIKRYIVTTGLSVDTPFDRKNERVESATKWMYENYPETTKDKQREYEMLSQSNFEWTLVRLPLIVETNERFDYKVSLDDCYGASISTADLGSFISDEIFNGNFLRKSPFLFNV
jgi:putative NADH-flavin reductase